MDPESLPPRLPAAEREFLTAKLSEALRTTSLLANRMSAFDEATQDAVCEEAKEKFYNNPDEYPCQVPTDEAEFGRYWSVFDCMLAGVDKIDTLFDAFIHQFFFFGTGDFVTDFCLAKYTEEDVSEIWLSAEEKSNAQLELLLPKQNSLRPLDPKLLTQKQNTRSALPLWTPIISDDLGGDESLIGSEVQRRSKSGKIIKYTVTRIDRDSLGHRVFIVVNEDEDEIAFSEEEMRRMIPRQDSPPHAPLLPSPAMVH